MESPLPFALSRVFGRIDPEQLEECFRTWTREAYEQTDGEVAQVDGKTLCGSGDAATGQEPRHLVEAWACEQGLTLGQRRSGGGSNEIKAIPELLETLVLEPVSILDESIQSDPQQCSSHHGLAGIGVPFVVPV
jgi:hypothetical protein